MNPASTHSRVASVRLSPKTSLSPVDSNIKILAALNPLKDLCGQARTTLGGILRFSAPSTGEPSRGIVIQPEEFHGRSALDAAKRYLKKRGDAGDKSAPIQDIIAAIRKGGGDPGSEEKLKVSLARSTWDVTKIGDDRFGLLEFFPEIKRGKKKKNGKETEAETDTTTPEAPTVTESAEQTTESVDTEA